MDRYPTIQVELTTETRLVDIVLDGCDAGIRLTESVPAGMVAVPLPFGLDFCVVGSPAYFVGNSPPKVPTDLVRQPMYQGEGAGRRRLSLEFERRGEIYVLDVPGSLMLDDQSLILRAAIDGTGLAYIARSIAIDAVSSGKLQRRA